ncbi:ABC transporter permease [Streptomyces sp. TS71-3]|nr:ABC transporter permease [Streptomyces sp. TS71-3]
MLGLLAGSGFRAAPLLMTASLVMGVVGSVASVSGTLGYRVMIDAATRHDGHAAVVGVVLVAVLFTVAWVTGVVGAMQSSILTDRVSLLISSRLARLTSSADTLELLEAPARMGDLDQIREQRRSIALAPRTFLRGLQNVVRGGGILVLLATVYPPVLIVPLLGAVPALADRRASRLRQRADDDTAQDRLMLGDLFTLTTTADTAKELRISGITGELAARHARLAERVRRRTVRAAGRSAAWEAAGWLVYAIGFASAVVVLVLRAAHGHATPGQVVMTVSLLRRAQGQVSAAGDTAGAVGGALRTARKLLDLEDAVAAARRRVGPLLPVPRRLADGIRLEGVTFAYPGAARPVLRDVDLTLPAGATVAVVGENGAGKTSLVKLLTGMYRPTAGRITVDGTDLAGIDPDAWRRRTTAAFQDFARYQWTARQTVGAGDLPRMGEDAAVRGAVERAGAGAAVDALPDGLDAQLGRYFPGGTELSGGQWQRLALARALMRQAPLLTVLDEPTAALDAATETALYARWAEAARTGAAERGAITVLVSHRFSTVRTADVIVVLDGGRVTEYGSHEDLLAAGGPYAQLFELQARGYLGPTRLPRPRRARTGAGASGPDSGAKTARDSAAGTSADPAPVPDAPTGSGTAESPGPTEGSGTAGGGSGTARGSGTDSDPDTTPPAEAAPAAGS